MRGPEKVQARVTPASSLRWQACTGTPCPPHPFSWPPRWPRASFTAVSKCHTPSAWSPPTAAPHTPSAAPESNVSAAEEGVPGWGQGPARWPRLRALGIPEPPFSWAQCPVCSLTGRARGQPLPAPVGRGWGHSTHLVPRHPKKSSVTPGFLGGQGHPQAWAPAWLYVVSQSDRGREDH